MAGRRAGTAAPAIYMHVDMETWTGRRQGVSVNNAGVGVAGHTKGTQRAQTMGEGAHGMGGGHTRGNWGMQHAGVGGGWRLVGDDGVWVGSG